MSWQTKLNQWMGRERKNLHQVAEECGLDYNALYKQFNRPGGEMRSAKLVKLCQGTGLGIWLFDDADSSDLPPRNQADHNVDLDDPEIQAVIDQLVSKALRKAAGELGK